MARVNNFLRTIRTGRFRSGKHDTELLPTKHPLSTRKNDVWDESELPTEAAINKADKPLNKPFRLPSGSSKKFGVYVKDGDKTKKVTFGDPNMEIRRDDPKARANFRSRHSCDTATDKTTARYWSCRMWEKGATVSDLTKTEIEGKILKADEEQRIVYGWASVITENGERVVDRQGDVIEADTLVKAVNDFMQWATKPGDTLTKRQYYPDLAKSTLFEAGYIAERSGHSRGSTVDITLIYRQGPRKGQALDMEGPWDFFGPRSWFTHPELLPEQKRNRTLLKDIMQKHGFRPYSKEWWHFTLDNEPFPDTYFDF